MEFVVVCFCLFLTGSVSSLSASSSATHETSHVSPSSDFGNKTMHVLNADKKDGIESKRQKGTKQNLGMLISDNKVTHHDKSDHQNPTKLLAELSQYKNDSCCKIYKENVIIADCCFCGLDYIPSDLPPAIDHLLLAYNKLTSPNLTPGAFSIYPNLTVLQLDTNFLTYLPDDVFEGLVKLEQLNIFNNSISLDARLNSSNVFLPLAGTLKVLVMNGNIKTSPGLNSVYPDYALSFLTELTSLTIDGLRNPEFKLGFGKLSKLMNLTMVGMGDGFCDLRSLRNSTFQHLPHLVHLNLTLCNLNGSHVESGALEGLTQLKLLDISNNRDLGLEAVGNLMYGIRNNKNFRYLKMRKINSRFAACAVVTNQTVRYLSNTSVELIESMDNEIEMVQLGALRLLPPTLTTLNLTNNKIMFGAYWQDMGCLKSLQNLHLDGYLHPVDFPNFYPSAVLHCRDTGDLYVTSDGPACADFTSGDAKNNNFTLILPPELRTLTMHSNSVAYAVTEINISPNNSLVHADLSGNTFRELKGPVTGLDKLQSLNLSSCFVQNISDTFFNTFPLLQELILSENVLGDRLNDDAYGFIFRNLTRVHFLNLSSNSIYRLNYPAFSDLNNLQILDLSNNRLSKVNFSIGNMWNLSLLDLHKNHINTLPQFIMDHIYDLMKAKINISVDLRENPISCDCDNLDFLEWVVKNKVFGSNYTQYYCKYDVANMDAVERFSGYDEEIRKLKYRCVAHIGLLFSVLGGTILVLAVIMGLVVYRFRWTLRYWYHAAKMKFYSNKILENDKFEYDVFISYENGDTDFVLQEIRTQLRDERNIRLLIHGEKFQVGRQIADNIYMAVRQCRKTLVVVSRKMLSSHWCIYELQMARLESVNTGRNVLIFFFMEEIPKSEMSMDVLSYIKSSTYIVYPRYPQHRRAFWDKLADDIRSR